VTAVATEATLLDHVPKGLFIDGDPLSTSQALAVDLAETVADLAPAEAERLRIQRG
jgi:hypothetical protein